MARLNAARNAIEFRPSSPNQWDGEPIARSGGIVDALWEQPKRKRTDEKEIDVEPEREREREKK